jgi:hypothetical protein
VDVAASECINGASLSKMLADPLDWNVRGLNNLARCHVVCDLVIDNACTIVCLQETKLQVVDNILIGSTLGQQFVDNYAVLPADGTRGNHHRLLLGSLLTDAS